MSELDQQIQELLSETNTKKKKGRRPVGKKKKIDHYTSFFGKGNGKLKKEHLFYFTSILLCEAML